MRRMLIVRHVDGETLAMLDPTAVTSVQVVRGYGPDYMRPCILAHTTGENHVFFLRYLTDEESVGDALAWAAGALGVEAVKL